jgi:hypothetical protein
MAHLLLGEKDLHRHRIGFETQRASPFMKRIKPQITRRSSSSLSDDPSLYATLQTVGGAGELYQRRSTIL